MDQIQLQLHKNTKYQKREIFHFVFIRAIFHIQQHEHQAELSYVSFSDDVHTFSEKLKDVNDFRGICGFRKIKIIVKTPKIDFRNVFKSEYQKQY